MGSCASVQKDSDPAMKLGLSVGSKNEKLLIPSPPVKQNSDMVNGGDRAVADVAPKSHPSPSRFPDAGSKEEAFFDSQPWLDSDCDDDFLSVNGDLTPSHGSTPVHHKFSVNKEGTRSSPRPSPQDKKKKLSELFKESMRDPKYVDEEENAATGTSGTPSLDGALGQEDKFVKSGQCCLPRLRSSRSFGERKKKTSPANSTNGR